MYLFFDTETTGFSAHKDRIIQLAFILADEGGTIHEEFESLIQPEDWNMPSVELFMREGMTEAKAIERSQFWVDNGYTQEDSELNGIYIYDALRAFQEALKQCKYKVAHNIAFDNRFIEASQLRESVSPELFRFKKGFCTMKASTDYCAIPKARGYGYKWPKLQELHKKLYNEEFEDAHDALADVKATKDCFFTLKNLGII